GVAVQMKDSIPACLLELSRISPSTAVSRSWFRSRFRWPVRLWSSCQEVEQVAGAFRTRTVLRIFSLRRRYLVSHVFINGAYQFEETLQQLERQGGFQLPPGRYWYDRLSGLAGQEGQGAAAVLPAGLDLGGPLAPDASNGASGVFLNGRELTTVEVVYL